MTCCRAEIGAWQHFESCTRELLTSYGYEEIRVPVVERTELFKRAIGEHTDVVGKEMYTFIDRGGDSLTLRPEATAGIVRALISNGMLRGQRHKLWCLGPMFRHETPQAGRYRQFWQVDVEAVGCTGPDVDAELIALSARLWQRLGISGLRLEINSLGTPESRREYRAHLTDYLRGHESKLDADSQRRLATNPLRILDSKNPDMQELIRGAPLLTEYLDAGVARALPDPVRDAAWGGRELRGQPASGARSRLLQPHGLRMDYAVHRRTECRMLRRPLRRADRAAGRRCDAGHRVRHGRRAAGDAPERGRPGSAAGAPGPVRGGQRRAGCRPGPAAGRDAAQPATAAADRAELRRGQLQGPVPPGRQERRTAGPHRR